MSALTGCQYQTGLLGSFRGIPLTSGDIRKISHSGPGSSAFCTTPLALSETLSTIK